jgi:hypothetical protein
MPRRKYGHMVRTAAPTPKEKCRICRHGKPCPVHPEGDIDYMALARKKRQRHSGGKKGRKRPKAEQRGE